MGCVCCGKFYSIICFTFKVNHFSPLSSMFRMILFLPFYLFFHSTKSYKYAINFFYDICVIIKAARVEITVTFPFSNNFSCFHMLNNYFV
jgi:hypothetical protein